MPWIDITRNINDGSTYRNTPLVRDLFVFNSILYAIIQTQSRDEGVLTTNNYKYVIREHLGADPPVVDTIWGNAIEFHPVHEGFEYENGGTLELNGFIYIGNKNTGEIYVNSTQDTIDGNWDLLTSTYGAPEYVGVDAHLRSLKVYNNSIYAAHRGGVSRFNSSDKTWELVAKFMQGVNDEGFTRDLLVYHGELYAAVSYTDIGIVYKYNTSVSDLTRWIKVAELPPESTDPIKLFDYQNELIVVANSPNQNIFYGRDIATNFAGNPQFLQGAHLRGIPNSIIQYSKDGALWVTCSNAEAALGNQYIGDLNGDGLIDSTDVTLRSDWHGASYTASTAPVNPPAVSDVNGDLVLDLLDVIQLSNYVAGTYTPPHLPTNPYNTTSRNKVLDLQEDINLASTQPSFDWAGFQNPTSFNARSYTNSSTLDEIVIQASVAGGTSSIAALTNTHRSDVVDEAFIYSHPLTDLDPTAIYEVTATVETRLWSPQYITGVYADNVGTCGLKFGFTQGAISTSDNEWLGASVGLPEAITTTPIPYWQQLLGNNGFWIASTNVSFGFTLANITAAVDLTNLRFKMYVSTPWNDIGIIYINLTGSDTIITDIPGLPQGSPLYYYYAPDVTIKDLTITGGEGIILGADYITQRAENINSVYKRFHTITSPSGPDEWFIRLPGIVNNTTPVLHYPDTITGTNFEGTKITRSIKSNPITLSTSGSYTFRMIYHIPQGIQTQNPIIHTYAYANNRMPLFDYTAVGVTQGIQNSIEIPFMTSGDISATDLQDINIRISLIETIDNNYLPGPLNLPDVYFSDIHLTEHLTGSPENLIYHFTGDTWNSTTSSEADPVTDSTIARSRLTQNFDNQSGVNQLYSIGGGRIWAWHYPSGLYSGSAFGPYADLRPQIISIL